MTPQFSIEITEGPLQGKQHSIRLSPGLILHQEAINVQSLAMLRVGRAWDCEICLPADDDQVSRHHFLLELRGQAVRIQDCGSRNGTLVNGVRLGREGRSAPASRSNPASPAAMELQDGDCILAGQTVFRVQIRAAAAVRSAELTLPSSLVGLRRGRFAGVSRLMREACRKQDEAAGLDSAPAPQSSPAGPQPYQECGLPLPPERQPGLHPDDVCAPCWQEAMRHPAQLLRLLLRGAGLTERQAAIHDAPR